MKLPKPTEGSFEPAPAGNHLAVCYRLVDLGTQESPMYGAKHQIVIGWELTDCLMDDGRPFTAQKWFTFSMHEKSNLRKDLESWRGRSFTEEEFETFDLKNILGTSCLLTVLHKDDNARVATVGALPKSMKKGKQVNETEFFSFQEPDEAAWAELPDWLKDKIALSPEYKALTEDPEAKDAEQEKKTLPLEDHSDIPF